MVYLHFPQALSEEELMLQTKYEKLKRKKKALQNLKTPSRGDGDGRHHPGSHHHHHGHHSGSHHHHHGHHAGSNHISSTGPMASKRAHVEARDAREVARKLIKSGAIAAIQKTPRREDQSAGFKRPCGRDRRTERGGCLGGGGAGGYPGGGDRPLSGYQPFSATQPDDFNNTGPIGAAHGHSPSSPATDHDRPRIKLFESMASMRGDSRADSQPGTGGGGHVGRQPQTDKPQTSKDPPKDGNTIYVTGYQISEQLLRNTFKDCGPIVNITMEIEKHRGFVTFQTKEAAASAISVYHSCVVSDTQLKVTYARRQPPVDAITAAHSAAAWSTAAANNSQKGNYRDSRQKVDYSENFFEWNES